MMFSVPVFALNDSPAMSLMPLRIHVQMLFHTAKDCQGHFSPKLYLAKSHGRGIFAKENVSPDQLLISVPSRCKIFHSMRHWYHKMSQSKRSTESSKKNDLKKYRI